ncbi:MAG: acetyl-CoA acetyltransferase, partial [Aeromicrobium sp.]|nr:acetyl-CoA acetyltransferase [Aeromicrobium sp.]
MNGVVISGIGQSDVGRKLGRSPLALTTQSSLEAVADAGLTLSDIDGISTWPGSSSTTPGFSGVGPFEVKDALGLDLSWFSGGSENGGQLGAIVNAYAAVEA